MSRWKAHHPLTECPNAPAPLPRVWLVQAFRLAAALAVPTMRQTGVGPALLLERTARGGLLGLLLDWQRVVFGGWVAAAAWWRWRAPACCARDSGQRFGVLQFGA